MDLNTVEGQAEFVAQIPKDQWCTEVYESGSRKCLMGHLKAAGAPSANHSLVTQHFGDCIRINDGDHRYAELGDSPKERWINAYTLKLVGLWEEANGF